MSYEKEWMAIKAGMLCGRRFSPKQIERLREMIWTEANDGRIEVMMLFFAEAMHDVLGFGHERTRRILHYIDDKMRDFTAGVEDGTFDVDDLRVRVFSKTHFMFAMSEKDQQHIVDVLTAAGYTVTVDAPEEEKDGQDGNG